MKVTYKLLIIAACCLPVQAFASEKLSVSELLDRYAANQNKIKSLIAKTEVAWIPSTEGIQDQKPRQSRDIVEFRYEHSGKDFKAYTCRTSFNLDDNGIWVEEKSRSTKHLWRDKRYYSYYRGPRLEVSKLYISPDPKFAGDKEPPAMPWDGVGPFRGILSGDVERIDSILRKSDSLSVRSALERVGSVDCYVIDAKSKHGTYAIWLDPEHGYGIAKAIVRKGPEDYIRGRPRSNYIGNPTDNYTDVTENVRFECVDGIWFPMEFELSSTDERKNETLSGRTQYKVVYLDVNPDHNALGSFRLDIQDGTRVKIAEAPGIRYTWDNEKKFVVDQWDGSIKYVPKDWSILVGVGKPLPKFDGTNLNLSAEQIKDRAILLCFFDMKQRPSRDCLTQLAQKAEELNEKGVTIAAVQTSQVTEKTLNEWTKKNNIPFPVGMITADIEKTRFNWGVRVLPWMILTDKQHIVTAEGFNPAELNEKLGNNPKHKSGPTR